MFRRHSRLIATVALSFFTWTSGGLFSLAHAAKAEVRKVKSEAPARKAEGAEERFAKLTEELTAELHDQKTTHEQKKQRLSARKGEIDTLDVAIRAELAATEKKLKDAKLPPEILARHQKFVKHYDDNLAELKGNIAKVEAAKDETAVKVEIDKALTHLQKTNAPSRHQKLDPNNLPHRQRKAVKREPRLKKEDFDRDLKRDKNAWRYEKRIQVAAAGALTGLLPPDDLAETVEVQFTPEIKAKALELGNSPVKIYEWVRNNIEFVPTWGSIQGAQMTLLTRQGNAFDTASLLIALLRAAGIHARYVTGTVELPIDNVMNWAGGFTDPMAALHFMQNGGIPVAVLTSGGTIVKVRLEHVWVEAFIDYLPSRGAKHINGKEDTWIKLDPSYKQYTYSQGVDIKSAVPFDAQTFLTQMQSSATIDETQGYVTGINSLLAQQSMQDYQSRVQSYIQQNYPSATVGDVLGKIEIVKKEYAYLLGSLPYRAAVKGSTFAAIPAPLRHKLTFTVQKDVYDEAPLTITKGLPELAGKRITLSYAPATPQDEAVINSYLPKPHADGTPIQPSELPTSLPAYLINVKPELRADGQVVATGAAVGLGSVQTITMTFHDPATGDNVVQRLIDAGEFDAVSLNLGRISSEQMTAVKSRLEATKAKLEAGNYAGLDKDGLLGDLLYATALTYHAEVGAMNFIAARTMGVNAVTLPCEAIFASLVQVTSMWGVPRSVSPGALNMDAPFLSIVKAKDGNSNTVRQYMLSSGMTMSALEHKVPEQLFSTTSNPAEGVSAVKALKIANDQGIPIYTVNQQNIATALPQLQVGQQVLDDIQNAINARKVVTVSKTNINFNGWVGCGYIIIDPDTGAGAYKISGGTNGGSIELDNVWGALDSIGTLISIQFAIMAAAISKYGVSTMFDGVAKKVGAVVSAIQWFQDLNDINNKPNQDAMQWLSAYIAISSCLLLGIAFALAIPASMPAMLALMLGIMSIFLVNLLKLYLLDYIYSTNMVNKNTYEA